MDKATVSFNELIIKVCIAKKSVIYMGANENNPDYKIILVCLKDKSKEFIAINSKQTLSNILGPCRGKRIYYTQAIRKIVGTPDLFKFISGTRTGNVLSKLYTGLDCLKGGIYLFKENNGCFNVCLRKIFTRGRKKLEISELCRKFRLSSKVMSPRSANIFIFSSGSLSLGSN